MRFEYKRRKHYVELQKIQSSAFVIIYQLQRVYIHSSECFHQLYLR